MDKYDTEPRRKLGAPISGLTDKALVTPSIPDISFISPNNVHPREEVSNNYNKKSRPPRSDNFQKLKAITEHSTEVLKKQDSGNDLRFKFYQKLKESTTSIVPVNSGKIAPSIEPIYRHISGHLQQNKSHRQLNSNNCVSRSKNDNLDNYNNLKLLLSLIKSQNQQIKSLEIQINALISIHQKEKINSEKIKLAANDRHEDAKISIGVMTSLEFTVKKTPNEANLIPVIDLPSLGPRINDPVSVRVMSSKHGGNFNTYGDNDCRSNGSHSDDGCARPKGKVSSKVGWTFYNNMMCQVNEMLDTQNDGQSQQQHRYQTQQSIINDKGQQRSMMQQWKIFKATMATGLGDDKIISIDERMNYDSSYYPKVNYQTNIVQTTNSIVDDNTSIHMQALALKYLGHNSESPNLQTLTKLMSVISTPINDGNNYNNNTDKLLNNIINDERYRQLLTLEDNSVYNYKGKKQNRQNLDISVLKRQPKYL
ncbi:GSCOCG00007309001-RA-CDS [Cotesia congregata]|nr:GSCOCG00007309001-RA-CDS [Cotesia congregata]